MLRIQITSFIKLNNKLANKKYSLETFLLENVYFELTLNKVFYC